MVTMAENIVQLNLKEKVVAASVCFVLFLKYRPEKHWKTPFKPDYIHNQTSFKPDYIIRLLFQSSVTSFLK